MSFEDKTIVPDCYFWRRSYWDRKHEDTGELKYMVTDSFPWGWDRTEMFDIGFSLSQLLRVVDDFDSIDELKQEIESYRGELDSEHGKILDRGEVGGE